jgi:hypothetical protein
MKLYVLMEYIPYEGGTLLGVFTGPAEAATALAYQINNVGGFEYRVHELDANKTYDFGEFP